MLAASLKLIIMFVFSYEWKDALYFFIIKTFLFLVLSLCLIYAISEYEHVSVVIFI